jgi:hypothetical protein
MNSQAATYLPAGKTVICHAGPHVAQSKIELPVFTCTKLGESPTRSSRRS